MIRVLIADDELPARQRLRQLLLAHPNFEVVAEAENGAQAMTLIASMSPDLLFLDIQMPQRSGMDVASCLPSPRPAIIFCTAFDQHAVDAFELDALDYLLKPVSRVRLEKALLRVAANGGMRADELLNPLLSDPPRRLSRFIVRSGARHHVIPAEEALYFESIDGLTRLMTHAGIQYWMDASLQQLEQRVDPKQFFRISRAVLVNTGTISEVHPMPGGGAYIRLKGGTQLDVSRRRVQELVKVIECG